MRLQINKTKIENKNWKKKDKNWNSIENEWVNDILMQFERIVSFCITVMQFDRIASNWIGK